MGKGLGRWRRWNWTMIAIVALAGAASPLAASEDALAEVGQPELRALAPAFAFPHTLVHAEFVVDVACAGYCYERIEHRLALNAEPMPDAISSQNMTGVVAGAISWAWGESGPRSFEPSFWLSDFAPGEYAAQVATRAYGDDGNWSVSAPRAFHVLSRADGDGDGVSDDLERRLCASGSGALEAQGGRDACAGDDLRIAVSLLLRLPQPLPSLRDADADGFPDALRTLTTEVRIPGSWDAVVAGPAYDSPFDTWNGAQLREGILSDGVLAEEPRASFWCAPIPTWTSASTYDGDGDGIPLYVMATTGQACVDLLADDAAPRANDAADMLRATIDLNDTHEDTAPPGDMLLLEAPLLAQFGEDDDADGLPDAAYAFVGRVTILSGSGGMLDLGGAWRMTTWDDFDDHDELPWLHVRADLDQDRVPDASEWLACVFEDPRTPVDGACDVALRDYHPPALYVSAYASPGVRDDADGDGASDAAEALACDASERWLFFPLCEGGDGVPLPRLPPLP